MDKRIANLYLTARRAGVCIDATNDCRPMLQAVVFLCQALGRPLQYRCLPTPIGPVSQQLRIDHAAHLENPKLYAFLTAGRDLLAPYLKAIDQVRKLQSLTPVAGAALPWMPTAAHIHMTSQERRVSYAAAAETLAKTKPAVARLMVPILYVMDNCGLMPQWGKPSPVP